MRGPRSPGWGPRFAGSSSQIRDVVAHGCLGKLIASSRPAGAYAFGIGFPGKWVGLTRSGKSAVSSVVYSAGAHGYFGRGHVISGGAHFGGIDCPGGAHGISPTDRQIHGISGSPRFLAPIGAGGPRFTHLAGPTDFRRGAPRPPPGGPTPIPRNFLEIPRDFPGPTLRDWRGPRILR